jgi:hypothetical protein
MGSSAQRKAKRDLIEELEVLGAQHEHTREIRTFFFEKAFPVDVRHNAKIHSLTLARKHSGASGPAPPFHIFLIQHGEFSIQVSGRRH